MMHKIRALLIKDFFELLSDYRALVLMLAMPLVLVAIMGFALSPVYRKGDAKIYVPFVDRAKNMYSEALAAELEKSSIVLTRVLYIADKTVPINEDNAIRLVRQGTRSIAIVVPQDYPGAFGFDKDSIPEIEISANNAHFDTGHWRDFWMNFGRGKAKLKIYVDPGKPELQGIVTGLLHQAAMKSLFETMFSSFSGKFRERFGIAEGTGEGGGMNIADIFEIETENVVGAGEKKAFDPFTHGLPGYAVMFLLFAALEGASRLIAERQSGVMARILAAPVGFWHIFAAKGIFISCMGVAQLLVLFAAGIAIFGISVSGSLLGLIAVSLATAYCAAGLGMLVFALSITQSQANALTLILVLSMSALGGSWFPTFFMPEWMQQAAKFTVNYWAVDGFMQVMWFGREFAAVIPSITVLGITGTVLFGLAWYGASRSPKFASES